MDESIDITVLNKIVIERKGGCFVEIFRNWMNSRIDIRVLNKIAIELTGCEGTKDREGKRGYFVSKRGKLYQRGNFLLIGWFELEERLNSRIDFKY